jgi:hypothetical protein
LFAFLIPSLAGAVNLSFGNPVGTSGSMTELFQAILAGILNIIAFLGVLFMVIGGVIYLMASTSGNENLIETAKKIWTGALIGLALALAGPSFLKQIQAILGPAPTSLDAAPSLSAIVTSTLSFLLSVIGILAIISLVINSILYLTSAGNSSRAEKIKSSIMYSIVGLLAAGSALIIVKQIVLLIET